MRFQLSIAIAESTGESPRKAAVMQICMDNTRCYVMHIFHSGIPPILKSLLEDNSSVKVRILHNVM